MNLRRFWPVFRILIALAAGTVAPISPALAETRSSPVHIIFPFAAGSSADTLARLIASELGAGLNRSVIVEPRPGAGGRIGARAVKSAAPDGDTLLLTPIAPMAVYQSIYPSLDYDPVKDFSPIAQVASYDFAIAVGNHVPARTLEELVAWIKSNPTSANFGMPGAGTLPHFFGVMFGRAIGAELQAVAYNGTAPLLTDLIGGRIPIVVHATNELVEMAVAGSIRVLATSDRQRSVFLPDVPTLQELGYALQGTGWYGLFAPAGTPRETIARLNTIVVEAFARKDIAARLAVLGLRPATTSPEAFAKIQQRDIALWAPAVKASGFAPSQ
jgi:tripartite-type tricarboxylate transporter receptor subunit TctC